MVIDEDMALVSTLKAQAVGREKQLKGIETKISLTQKGVRSKEVGVDANLL
jgi:hypothetical protein